MKQTLFILGTTMVTTLLLIGSLWFVTNSIQDMRERAYARESTIEVKEQRIANSEAQRRVLRELEREGVSLERFFFKEGEALEIINHIEALGIESGSTLVVRSVRASDTVDSPLGVYIVDADVEGSFGSVHYFLERIEHMPYAVRIVSYDVGLVEEEDNQFWKGAVSIAVAYIRDTSGTDI